MLLTIKSNVMETLVLMCWSVVGFVNHYVFRIRVSPLGRNVSWGLRIKEGGFDILYILSNELNLEIKKKKIYYLYLLFLYLL